MTSSVLEPDLSIPRQDLPVKIFIKEFYGCKNVKNFDIQVNELIIYVVTRNPRHEFTTPVLFCPKSSVVHIFVNFGPDHTSFLICRSRR